MIKPLLTFVASFAFSQSTLANCPLSLDDVKLEQDSTSLTLDQQIACLSSDVAGIRDGIAFNMLSKSLRDATLPLKEVKHVHDELIRTFNNKTHTSHHHSFIILSLAEVARFDRKTPFLNNNERKQLLNISTDALINVNDYTGFSEDIGYIHQIAHASDLALQLSLNQAFDEPQLKALSQAIQQAINPSEIHFYIYGEPDRLVRATVYLMLRESMTLEYWSEWLSVAAHPPFSSWQEAYETNEGLAALHNTQSFFNRLLVWTANSKNAKLTAINKQVLQHLKTIQ